MKHKDGGCLLPGMIEMPKTVEDYKNNARIAANADRMTYSVCRVKSTDELFFALWIDAGYGEHVGEWEVLDTIEPEGWSA
jgi:hypothetical protein